MTLGEILSGRADNARTAAAVDCGALGTLTLEALAPRELERYQRLADADRAIFYAACRELQRTGAALLKEGKVYRPDQVTALVSDAEAARAADAVRALSGLRGGAKAERVGEDEARTDGGEMSEIRPDIVQENEEVRHDTVQKNVTENGEIRLSPVQESGETREDGQISREFLPENGDGNAKTDKLQVLWPETAQTPQNVGKSDSSDSGLRKSGSAAAEKTARQEEKKEKRLHETKSEFRENLHETKSEFREELHEIKSESGGEGDGDLHEIKSEFREELHEIKSESGEKKGGALHETKSEFRENLHEDRAALAEYAARELLDGLRRAAWVR